MRSLDILTKLIGDSHTLWTETYQNNTASPSLINLAFCYTFGYFTDLAEHVAAQQERLEGLEDMQGRILRTIPLPGEVVLDAKVRRDAARELVDAIQEAEQNRGLPGGPAWSPIFDALAKVQALFPEFVEGDDG